MSRRTAGRAAPLLLAAVSILSAACGGAAAPATGDAPVPSVDATFQRRAEGVCADIASRLRALPPFPYQGFDPLHPQPSLLPGVARYFRANDEPVYADAVVALRALGEPSQGRGAWDRLTESLDGWHANEVRQDAAAAASDVDAFVGTVHTFESLAGDLVQSAQQAGVGGCAHLVSG